MTSAAIVKRDETIDSLRSRLTNLREKVNLESREVMGSAAAAAAAYLYGAAERKGERDNKPLTSLVEGVPARLSYGAAAYVAGRFVGGDAGLVMQNAGRALITIHAYMEGRDSVR